jgi:inhibitor of KinA sporulation pathway (predicted exonuclease)
MPRRDNRIVNVVDVEATCWERDDPEQAGQVSEIIEIGITRVHVADLRIERLPPIFVKPARSRVGAFCERLTGRTQALLDREGISFPAACRLLSDDHRTLERVVATWGDYDRKQFARDAAAHNLPPPLDRHWNLKTHFALVLGLKDELGVPQALARLGLAFEGAHHTGADDSYNIARLMVEVLRWARLGREGVTRGARGTGA